MTGDLLIPVACGRGTLGRDGLPRDGSVRRRDPGKRRHGASSVLGRVYGSRVAREIRALPAPAHGQAGSTTCTTHGIQLPPLCVDRRIGPISVVVRGLVPLGGLAEWAGGAHGKYWFSVNNCLYACIDDNEPAREINTLLASDEPSRFPSRPSLVARQPAWVLRYGSWPAWTLTWDRANESRQYRPGWVLRKTPNGMPIRSSTLTPDAPAELRFGCWMRERVATVSPADGRLHPTPILL